MGLCFVFCFELRFVACFHFMRKFGSVCRCWVKCRVGWKKEQCKWIDWNGVDGLEWLGLTPLVWVFPRQQCRASDWLGFQLHKQGVGRSTMVNPTQLDRVVPDTSTSMNTVYVRQQLLHPLSLAPETKTRICQRTQLLNISKFRGIMDINTS